MKSLAPSYSVTIVILVLQWLLINTIVLHANIRYEKLQRWDDALKAYTAKSAQASSQHLKLEATLGTNLKDSLLVLRLDAYRATSVSLVVNSILLSKFRFCYHGSHIYLVLY